MRWVFVFAFLISLNSNSQISTELKKYKEDHPNSHSVRLNQETKITIELKKGNFLITEETIEEDLFEETTFDSVDHIKNELLEYLVYYNHERPHQGLNGKTPADFAKNCPRIT